MSTSDATGPRPPRKRRRLLKGRRGSLETGAPVDLEAALVQAVERRDWLFVSTIARALAERASSDHTRLGLLVARMLHATGDAAAAAREVVVRVRAEAGDPDRTARAEALANAAAGVHDVIKRLVFEQLGAAPGDVERGEKLRDELYAWGTRYVRTGRPQRGRPRKGTTTPASVPGLLVGSVGRVDHVDFCIDLRLAALAAMPAPGRPNRTPRATARADRWRSPGAAKELEGAIDQLWRTGDEGAIARVAAEMFATAGHLLDVVPKQSEEPLEARLRKAILRVRGKLAPAMQASDAFVRALLIAYGVGQRESTRLVRAVIQHGERIDRAVADIPKH